MNEHAQEERKLNEEHLIFNALVVLTDYDQFALKGEKVYYGDDYEHPVPDQMLNEISETTELPLWKVQEIARDFCEVRQVIGPKWQIKNHNGFWRDFLLNK